MASRAELISEKDLQATIVEMALAHGWKVYGVIDRQDFARRYDKGFPDLTLVRGPVLYWVEVKSQKGKLTPAREKWMRALKDVAAHCEYIRAVVWRPSNLRMIEARLTCPSEEELWGT